MVQRRRGLRLRPKSPQALPVLRHIFRKELQSDEAVEPCVLRLVHHSHTAAAQLLDDAVMRNNMTDHPRSPTGLHLTGGYRTSQPRHTQNTQNPPSPRRIPACTNKTN